MIETIHHDEKIGFLKFMQAIGDVALYGLNDAASELVSRLLNFPDDTHADFGGDDD